MTFPPFDITKMEYGKWYYDAEKKVYIMYSDWGNSVTIDEELNITSYCDDLKYKLATKHYYKAKDLEDAIRWVEGGKLL